MTFGASVFFLLIISFTSAINDTNSSASHQCLDNTFCLNNETLCLYFLQNSTATCQLTVNIPTNTSDCTSTTALPSNYYCHCISNETFTFCGYLAIEKTLRNQCYNNTQLCITQENIWCIATNEEHYCVPALISESTPSPSPSPSPSLSPQQEQQRESQLLCVLIFAVAGFIKILYFLFTPSWRDEIRIWRIFGDGEYYYHYAFKYLFATSWMWAIVIIKLCATLALQIWNLLFAVNLTDYILNLVIIPIWFGLPLLAFCASQERMGPVGRVSFFSFLFFSIGGIIALILKLVILSTNHFQVQMQALPILIIAIWSSLDFPLICLGSLLSYLHPCFEPFSATIRLSILIIQFKKEHNSLIKVNPFEDEKYFVPQVIELNPEAVAMSYI